ncbi:hypothetical protein OAL67_01280, partial [bacterium]|nr:hypothetical protein [bacterium]
MKSNKLVIALFLALIAVGAYAGSLWFENLEDPPLKELSSPKTQFIGQDKDEIVQDLGEPVATRANSVLN